MWDPEQGARLVVEHADGDEVHHLVVGREITIGRDPSNRVCIPDRLVSSFHAKLIRSDEAYTLVDLGSANKTRVGGRVVDRAPLFDGDEIRFASVRCRWVAPAPMAHHPGGKHGGMGSSGQAAESVSVHGPSQAPRSPAPRGSVVGLVAAAVVVTSVLIWLVMRIASA